VPPPCYRLHREFSRIDSVIESAISGCHPRSWNEDHISYSWLQALLKMGSQLSIPLPIGLSVAWDAYKQDGVLEQDNGDIAFLVKLVFPNGNELIGVGFLEAKRIYESGKYDALKWAQLRRMNTNSTSHQLLLFDFEPQQIIASQGLGCCLDGPGRCQCERSTSALVTPTVHALAYEEKDRSLSSICSGLTEQIFFRYFRGLDLNFDKDLVENVKNGNAGGVKFLAIASVRLGEGSKSELSFEGLIPNQRSPFRRFSRE
jgi:hypothetical protein